MQIQHAWMAEPQDMKLPPIQVPSNLTLPASQNFEELAALVCDCTDHDPTKRPSFYEICLRLRNLPPRSSSMLNSPVSPNDSLGFRSTRQGIA